jgi:DNA recombination protein RmuC
MATNAVEVAKVGRELFDRIASLNDRFGALGRKLDGAVEAYNAAIGTFETRVQVSARRMAELGVATDAVLDPVDPIEHRARPMQPLPEADTIDPRSNGRAGA